MLEVPQILGVHSFLGQLFNEHLLAGYQALLESLGIESNRCVLEHGEEKDKKREK